MERRAFRVSGFLLLAVLVAVVAAVVWIINAVSVDAQSTRGTVVTVGAVLVVVILAGFTVVNPNEARVMQFFGRYVGSIREAGFHWTVPFSTKRKVSLRVRNFETARLKVSDFDGNPVEIAAVVVWQVVDSAAAVFAVDNHVEYVSVQSEAAVRHLATTHPYEAHEPDQVSLRSGADVSEE